LLDKLEDILIIATMFHFYKHQIDLKKGSAILLLLVFLFALAPKRILHHLFANHTDAPISSKLYSKNSASEISKAGFNCQLDHLVVESSYLFSISNIHIQFYPTFINLIFEKENNAIFYYARRCFLRGPPFSC